MTIYRWVYGDANEIREAFVNKLVGRDLKYFNDSQQIGNRVGRAVKEGEWPAYLLEKNNLNAFASHVREILRANGRTAKKVVDRAGSWKAYLKNAGGYTKVCEVLHKMAKKGDEDVSEFVADKTDVLLGYLGKGGYQELVGKAINDFTYDATGRQKPTFGRKLAGKLVEVIEKSPRKEDGSPEDAISAYRLVKSFSKLYGELRKARRAQNYSGMEKLIDSWEVPG